MCGRKLVLTQYPLLIVLDSMKLKCRKLLSTEGVGKDTGSLMTPLLLGPY